MMKRGRVAWIFPDNFDADFIIGVENITETDPYKLAKLCMLTYDPEFSRKLKPGDMLVAGKNFGYGHPHAQPLIALKALKIDCIIAENFFPPFFRNGVFFGITLMECNNITKSVKRWDELEINVENAEIKNVTTGVLLHAKSLHPTIIKIISEGGVVSYLKNKLGARGKL